MTGTDIQNDLTNLGAVGGGVLTLKAGTYEAHLGEAISGAMTD